MNEEGSVVEQSLRQISSAYFPDQADEIVNALLEPDFRTPSDDLLSAFRPRKGQQQWNIPGSPSIGALPPEVQPSAQSALPLWSRMCIGSIQS